VRDEGKRLTIEKCWTWVSDCFFNKSVIILANNRGTNYWHYERHAAIWININGTARQFCLVRFRKVLFRWRRIRHENSTISLRAVINSIASTAYKFRQSWVNTEISFFCMLRISKSDHVVTRPVSVSPWNHPVKKIMRVKSLLIPRVWPSYVAREEIRWNFLTKSFEIVGMLSQNVILFYVRALYSTCSHP